MKKFLKSNWFGLISILLSICVLVGAFIYAEQSGDFTKILKQINVLWLLLAVGCLIIYWVFDGLILQTITRIKYSEYGILKSIKTSIIGLLYNALTPFSLGGQPMQVLVMTKDGIDVGDASSFITVKSIIHQICLTGYALFSIIITAGFYSASVPHFKVFVILGFIFNIIFICGVFLICVHKGLTTKITNAIIGLLIKIKVVKHPEAVYAKVNTQVGLFHKSSTLINNDKWKQFLSYLMTVTQLTFFYCIPYCIYRGLGLSGTTAIYIIAAQAIIAMITAFVPVPGASGAAEGSFYIFFSIVFTNVTVVPALIIWRVLTYYSCIVVGGIVSLFGVLKANRNTV